MLIIGVDPGLGASPTGVALVRFDGLTPHLVDRWTLKSERGDWQTRCGWIKRMRCGPWPKRSRRCLMIQR